jgi:hypothetical protein
MTARCTQIPSPLAGEGGREPNSAPSPLEGEGRGGGCVVRAQSGLPPSRRRFTRSTSPTRGEVSAVFQRVQREWEKAQ